MTSTPPRPQPQRQPPVRVQRTSQPPVPALQTEESVPDIKSLGLSFEHKAPNRVDVTPAQAKAWDETRTALLWGSPAFSHILYTMMGEGGPTGAYFTNEIPIAACDDKFLFLNPEAYFRYNLGERVFIAGHEIIHAIMAHCGQLKRHERRGKISYPDGVTLPFDVNLFNQSLDYIVNDLLVESRVGTKPADCFHDKSIATGNDSAIEVFRRLYEDQEIQSKGGGDKGQDNGKGRGKGFDEHLQPGSGEGKNPTQAEQDRNSSEWSTAVAAAMHSAKVQGKLPAAMEEFFKHLLEPQISWAEKIEAFFARKVGNQTYSWAELDRQLVVRGIGAPGRVGYGAGTIVVAIDTSGSIGIAEVETFFGEVRGILEDLRPKKLFIVQCDAAVQVVDEAVDDLDLRHLRDRGIKGRGGTAFEPVFDWVANNHVEPECVVYLTDLYGSFPQAAPSYPTLWASISKGINPPWGDLVEVPVQQRK